MAVAVGDHLDFGDDTASPMLALQRLEQPVLKHPIALFRRPRTLEVIDPNVERQARTAVRVWRTVRFLSRISRSDLLAYREGLAHTMGCGKT